jgi:Uma2 family endonuclease
MNTLNRISNHAPVALAVQQLRQYPRLPQVIEEFLAMLQVEQEQREQFYAEISEEQKAEFINGEVIVHSPVKLRHGIVSQNIFTLLNIYVRQHQLGLVGHEKWLIALTRNDYEPDIVYFAPEKAQTFTPQQMKFPAPDLVVEVLSPSTEDRDRGIKFQDYAAHNVIEYWIIDPDQKTIEQYVLHNRDYELRMKSTTGTVQSVAIPGFLIPVPAIFDESTPFTEVSTS